MSYIGDASVGANADIGAARSRATYDGTAETTTATIARMRSIGSNTALVAPVEIGDGAYVGSAR